MIAEDHTDPIHEILDDLGDVPEVDSLIGNNTFKHTGSLLSIVMNSFECTRHYYVLNLITKLPWYLGDGGDYSAANRSTLAKTEISLTLSNKFEVLEEEQSDIKDIMIR